MSEEIKVILEKLNNMEGQIKELKQQKKGTLAKLVKAGSIITKKVEEKTNVALDKFIDHLENGTPEQPKQQVNSIVIKNGDINIYRGGKEPIVIRNKECVEKILKYIEEVVR